MKIFSKELWICSIFRYLQTKSRKYQGVFKVKNRVKYGKLEEPGLNNSSISKSQKGGRNQVSRRVSASCWYAISVTNAPWKPFLIRWRSSSVHSLNRHRVGKTGLYNRNICNPPPPPHTHTHTQGGGPRCRHATPVANASWKPLIIWWKSSSESRLGSHSWSRVRMPFNICVREISYCLMTISSVSQGIPVWVAYLKVVWPSE